ncbi:MAG: lytic murein transglycosylase, partial [Betaproteobacteria bacterium AqS2]|nr:lytic murein transglycosylase [Betaproteobacteria bacterium AqS2]
PVHAGPYALVDLENEDEVVYRAGTMNYYALTRYNRSNKYAMTVYDLAREIKERL